ncbi:MAG: sulfotransferase family 2 domain-containing protein [Acidimicrobiia bacterium]|nr:sulfotransferase family 2 domain-containing protein [Acidimicrobiia bacterium]MDH5236714.1 sulfotransferase family 2 domain-containing protein [Acidimicrobiia bacterium]
MTDTQRYFFLHIMKTAGASFRQHLRLNFTKEERYPNPDVETISPVEFNVLIDYVIGLPPERHEALRCYAGHFPYMVTTKLPHPVSTFTILRHPVGRVLSYLKQRRLELGLASLEEVYEDEFTRRCLLDNHQVKLFSLDEADRPESIMDVIDIDQARFDAACANLDRVDVVGVTERYDDFCTAIVDRFGWRLGDFPDRRVADPITVPPSLEARIAADNAFDVAFHEYALRLVQRRASTSPPRARN